MMLFSTDRDCTDEPSLETELPHTIQLLPSHSPVGEVPSAPKPENWEEVTFSLNALTSTQGHNKY